jgi:hypothetical protein
MASENIQTFLAKQEEQKLIFQQNEDDLLKIHLQQIENMQKQILEEKMKRLQHIRVTIEHTSNMIHYHSEEFKKHQEIVAANEKIVDSLILEMNSIKL